MLKVNRAFEAYYADKDADAPMEDLERDPYAKFFHQWLTAAQGSIDDDGLVHVLSTSALAAQRARTAVNATPSTAPRDSWRFLGPKQTLWRADHNASQPDAPWQVNIYCLAVAEGNPGLLYCGSETGALYKSIDRGLNWRPFDNFNWGRAILSVAIDPLDEETVYVGTSTDIVKTENGGASWSIVYTGSGLSCNSIAVSPTVPGTALAGTGSGVLGTTDGGVTWSLRTTKHADDVEFRPGDGSTVYAIHRNGTPDTYDFMKSVDGGMTFATSMGGWGNLFEASGARICVTEADANYVYAMLLTHDGTGSDSKPYVMKSVDAGVTWNVAAIGNGALPISNGQGYYDMDIVASQTDPEKIIAATTSAARSVDGGATWTLVGGYGGPFGIHPDIQALVSVTTGAGEDTWIATDGGVNYSSDFYGDTANWEPRFSGIDGTNFWGFAQGWNEDYLVGGRYHNGNTVIHENYPDKSALRLGGAESVTGWALHGRERYAAFDDISELILPAQIDEAPEGTFAFTKHPHNHYYGTAFSRVMVDLEDFMTVYLGADNSFWRSRDGGGQWEAIATIPGKPYHFDISRADGNYIYMAADSGFYRSTDRGESFSEMTLPPGLTDWHSRDLRVAAGSLDRDDVWLLNARSSATSTAGRVFVSQDGGTSWTDWTTPALAGRRWLAIAHQAGTNGGIYLASQRGDAGTNPARVVYRDLSMSEWADHSAGLPASASPIKLLPFYRDGVLRWGGNRGAWEIDFYEPNWTPIAQPFVSGKTQFCARDIVEFDSYSVARGDVTYQWSIPGANWTTALDVREVQATFPSDGTYTATLTITQGTESDTKSVQVEVTSDCEAEVTPGNALDLPGEGGDYGISAEPLGITTNTFTLTAWIKRNGPQHNYTGIVFERGATSAGLNFRDSTNLGFHWQNSQWGWNSGLSVPDGQWAHVALCIEPDQARLYLNGVEAVRPATLPPYEFNSPIRLGADPHSSGRRFRGQMDEVAIYDRALSAQEVRSLMHLTLDPSVDPNLIAYWQFNRPDGVATDRVGINHMSLAGNATRVLSTAPVGGGTSAFDSILFGGSYSFGTTGLHLDFAPGTLVPLGETHVTRIDQRPLLAPSDFDAYWIVRTYGGLTSFNGLDSLRFDLPLTTAQATTPEQIFLYKRAAGAVTFWDGPIDVADAASPGNPGTAVFSTGNGQTTFGSYTLTVP